MDSFEIVKAIKHLKPTAQFSLNDCDYSTIKWDVLEGDAPTWEEILEAHSQVKIAEETAKAQAEAKRQTALSKLTVLGLEPQDLEALGF